MWLFASVSSATRIFRSTPDWGPWIGSVRFPGLEVRSTSDSRRRWARSAKTGFDPEQTFLTCSE